MILLQDTLATHHPFWTSHYDFLLFCLLSFGGIVVSAFGLNYSIKAFREAEQAKDAANQAGLTVKTQEIIMELERISNSCQFEETINFPEANKSFNEISARVYGILGLYKTDNDIKDEIQQIQDNLANVKTSLDTANRSNPSSPLNDASIGENILQNYVYNITAPHFTNLISSLNKLKGILNSRLIKTN
ncbi:MAG: hypothetical protein IPJ79_08100 [Bacteroidetes bacterium]|nr:hypothetical protein [Bacteroidota bacterium]